MRTAVVTLCLISAALTLPGVGYAQQVGNYMCDPGAENCRAKLIALIDTETQAIDAAFWFMEDARFSQALIRAKNRGVNVRVVTDARGWAGGSDYPGYPTSKVPVDQLYAAGIPIRQKTGGGGILHFKMMLLYGHNMLEFSGANYTDYAFVRVDYPTSAPYSNFVDEAIVFTNDDELVKSFMTRFDDIWTDVSTGSQSFANYCPTPIPAAQAGCTTRTPTRRNEPFTIDSEMNFVPWNNFGSRSVGRYNAELATGGIDAIIYRITDASHTEALIRAAKRGVPVRVITEPQEYRNPGRFWNSYNFDRLYLEGQKCAATPSLCAGTGSIQVRFRSHPGLLHEKLTVLRGQQMFIVGSSNWTSGSAGGQHEHNLFGTRVKRPWAYDWAVTHFNHKWTALSQPMVPLPPDRPLQQAPANAAANQASTVTLKWYAGLWGMKYDIRLGTSPTSMSTVVAGRELGPSQSTSDLKSISVTNLAPGTTYYWQVVSSTMANLTRTSLVWSFTTSGGLPPPPPPATTCGALPSGWASQDVGAVATAGASCFDANAQTYTVRGSGADIWNGADEFRFVYRQLTGDGTVFVRVAQLGQVDPWTKTGVMMRETLSAGSKHVSMLVSGSMGTAFQRRAATDGVTTHTAGPVVAAPYWVGLRRRGNVFTAYVSSDGASWTAVGSETIAMGATINVGIPLTSHLDGTLATATVSNVNVTMP